MGDILARCYGLVRLRSVTGPRRRGLNREVRVADRSAGQWNPVARSPTSATIELMNSEQLANLVREQSLDVFARMFRAVELVQERLNRACGALREAKVPYAVIGGNAVAAWVATIDDGAVRNTRPYPQRKCTAR